MTYSSTALLISKPASRCPRKMFRKLDASRHFGEALAMLRQIEFALFDFRLHAGFDPGKVRRRWLPSKRSVRRWR